MDRVRGFAKIGTAGPALSSNIRKARRSSSARLVPGRERPMKISKRLSALVSAAVLSFGAAVAASAQQRNEAAAVAIGEKEIGGVVSSPQGREAGAWVIAETNELPTRFRRIVVTDDQGRYLVPDLPQADYNLW